MNFKATRHAATVVAAGAWICLAGPLGTNEANAQTPAPAQATAVGSATDTSAEPGKPTRLHARKASWKSRKAHHHAKAKKPAVDEDTAKADDKAGDTTAQATPGQDNAAMPPAVANANAQWPADAAAPTNTYNMSAQAGNVLSQMGAQQPDQPATASPGDSASDAQVVAADQLNDLDRAAEDKPPLTLAKATLDTPEDATPVAATAANNRPWEQTSLIGKVFIAFGGLLTIASAVRMFMA